MARARLMALNHRLPLSASHAAEGQDGLPNPQRLLAFVTLAVGTSMAVLDGTIVAVGAADDGAPIAVAPENAIWIVNAFQLAVTVSLLPLAALGDRVGYRRIYGRGKRPSPSLRSAARSRRHSRARVRAPRSGPRRGRNHQRQHRAHPLHLSARRLGQGVGNMAVVVGVGFRRKPERRGGDPFGRLMALAVSDQRSDRRAGAHHGGANAAGDAAHGRPPRFWSVILNALTFGLVIAGVNGIGQGGIPLPALIEIVAGAAIGVILVRRQLKLPAPLLPVDLLRRPVFALSLMTSISSFGAQALAIVSLPFYFEDRLGHSATTTGLLLTPGRSRPR